MANDYVEEKKNDEISFSRQCLWVCATDGPLISVVKLLLSLKVFFTTVDGRYAESTNLSICFPFLKNLSVELILKPLKII